MSFYIQLAKVYPLRKNTVILAKTIDCVQANSLVSVLCPGRFQEMQLGQPGYKERAIFLDIFR